MAVPVSARTLAAAFKAGAGELNDDESGCLGQGAGVYSRGRFTCDVTTVIAHDHAATSNDDLFA
jgi:hypothetical protein